MTNARRIPVVNLEHYRSGTAEERARFVQVYGEGLREFGFVTVNNHGVDDALIRRTYGHLEAFYKLPEEVKKTYDVPGGAGQRGYTGYGKEHAKNRAVGDLKEFWHVGREVEPGHRYADIYKPNVWPAEVPGFKDDAIALYDQFDALGKTLLEALAAYFDLPEDTFASMAKGGNSVLRAIHYPPLKDRLIPGGVRAAEHEDINLITMLCESTAGGLELLTRDGEWMPVGALDGQIVVDSGDMLQRVTNGVIPATTHRVVNPTSEADDKVRYSMPFFVHPYPDCSMAPVSKFVGEGYPTPPPELTAQQFLEQRLREIGLLKG